MSESMSEPMLLLIHSAKQVVRVTGNNQTCLKGAEMKSLSVIVAKPGEGLSIVVGKLVSNLYAFIVFNFFGKG